MVKEYRKSKIHHAGLKCNSVTPGMWQMNNGKMKITGSVDLCRCEGIFSMYTNKKTGTF